MTRKKTMAAALLTVLWGSSLGGCGASMDLNEEAPTSEGSPAAGSLRIDVYPPTMEPKLLPQTHVVEPQSDADDGTQYQDVILNLRDTVELFGTLTGLVTNGWAQAASAPATEAPLVARVSASQIGTLQSTTTLSDSTGYFTLELVSGDDYDISILPADATRSPFIVQAAQAVHRSQDLSEQLPSGAPIYGRVQDAAGTPIPGASLHLRRTDIDVDVVSASFVTDEAGWFVSRVMSPGEYAVELEGGLSVAGTLVPSLVADVSVADEGGAYTVLDVGVLSGNTIVTGAVLDGHGARLQDAKIQLVSQALDGCEACTLTQQTETDNNGLFIARLLPGDYEMDIVPAPVDGDPSASPVRVPLHVSGGTNDLADLHLGGPMALSGQVVGTDGRPADSVVVLAHQVDFGQFEFQTTTDTDGGFAINVPEGEYALTLLPKAGSAQGAVTHATVVPGDYPIMQMAEGKTISGTVLWADTPVEWALIEIHDYDSGDLLGTTTSGPDGTFSLLAAIPHPSDGADTGSGDTGSGGDTGGKSDTGSGETGGSSGGTDTGGGTGAGSDTATGGDTAALR